MKDALGTIAIMLACFILAFLIQYASPWMLRGAP